MKLKLKSYNYLFKLMKVNDQFKKKKKTGNSNSLKTNLIVCKDGHSREQKLPLSLYCLQN